MPENPDTLEFLPELTDREKAAVLDELYTDHDWREEHFVDEAYELAMRWNPYEAERLTREIHHETQVRAMNRHAQEVADLPLIQSQKVGHDQGLLVLGE